MTKKNIEDLGKMIITTMRCINITERHWNEDPENSLKSRPRTCWDSELRGMFHTLITLNIDYKVNWSDDSATYKSIDIMGTVFEVK